MIQYQTTNTHTNENMQILLYQKDIDGMKEEK
jgi:hypothetical protein